MLACIKFAKTNPNAIIPNKRHEDACFDLWGCEGDLTLSPHETRLIDTGIATAFDPEWVAIIKERSSLGVKGLAVMAGVIDSGYRSSWKVCLQNNTNEIINIPKEKAIAQFMLLPVPEYDVETWDYQEVLQVKSERGIGGFGSTDEQ